MLLSVRLAGHRGLLSGLAAHPRAPLLASCGLDRRLRVWEGALESDAPLWESLSEEEQGWVRKAAAESSEFQRAAWEAGVQEALEVMKEQGVTVHEVAPEPFMKATESVRNKYAEGEVKELLNRIGSVTTK